MTALIIICCYLSLLVGLGILSSRLFRGTSGDFFLASHSIGPFLLLMSVFGTTMTAFAMIGSTGQAYQVGVATYGKMASYSGLIHSACFFFIGLPLWALGKKHGYTTQIEYFRDRFQSPALGYLLFPILVGLVIPYLLMGLLGAGSVVQAVTKGALPEIFPATDGAVPGWVSGLVISLVVLSYVSAGGVRSAAWANAFQTSVFMVVGIATFIWISNALGGVFEASSNIAPEKLVREGNISEITFFTYGFIPLSVAMFPHLFQHWLTAKSAKTFRLTLIAHPVFIMITWVPCIFIGLWATGVLPEVKSNAVLGMMVAKLTTPLLAGLVTAGVLAAIMSSLDSQFVCLGTMFTKDVALRICGKENLTESQTLWLARGFITLIIAVTYLLSLTEPRQIFQLGVWCFSGFAGLSPIVMLALYWKDTTKAGAIGGVVAAALSWVTLFTMADFGALRNFTLGGVMPVAAIFGLTLLTTVVVSCFTKAPDEKHLQRFFTY